MRILDRYILKSVLGIFISCIFAFLFMYVIIDVLSHLEDILKHQAQIFSLIQYYLYNLPVMFVQVSPFACLLSTLYAFGRLNHDNEIIAMRASGLSVHQIAKTVIICGAIISLFVFWLNDKFIPRSLAMTQKIKSTMGETKKAKEKKEETIRNLFMLGLRNRLFFINKFALSTNTMEDIIILEDDEHQNVIRKIVAKKGLYQDNLWKFYQCITYNFDQNGQIAGEPQYFEEEVMPITETPSDFINQRQRPELMTIAQLEDYIWRLSRSGASTLIRNLKVDLYHRFTAPFSNLIIVLLGIPFSMMLKRRATGLSSVGLAIMVGFLYYALDAIFIAFGKGGALIPILGASLSHIVALTFGLYLISALP